jgi:hypothetical protein
VTDVAVKAVGAGVAVVSVVASGMQQITCGELQRNHDLTPNQLLSVSAPLQVCCAAGRWDAMSGSGAAAAAAAAASLAAHQQRRHAVLHHVDLEVDLSRALS